MKGDEAGINMEVNKKEPAIVQIDNKTGGKYSTVQVAAGKG
jgi:hypothetical protein